MLQIGEPRLAPDVYGANGALLSTLARFTTRPRTVAVLIAIALPQAWHIIHQLPARRNTADFSLFYVSALLIRQGENPYKMDLTEPAHELGLDLQGVLHATSEPTFLLCFAPLTLLPLGEAYFFWLGFNAVLLVIATCLLLQKLGVANPRLRALLGVLVVFYPPVGDHFLWAQCKIPVLTLIILVVRKMGEGKERAAGWCLAAAGLITIFPFLLLLYFVFQRRWVVLFHTCVASALVTGMTLLIVGPDTFFSFRRGVQLVVEPTWLAMDNVALWAFVSRMFWYAAGRTLPRWLEVSRITVAIAADIGAIWLTCHATLQLKPKCDLEWRCLSLWTVASVLLSPTAWMYDLVLLMILYAQLALAVQENHVGPSAVWTAIFSFAAMLARNLLLILPIVMKKWSGAQPSLSFAQLVNELGFVSLLLAFVAAYLFVINPVEMPTVAHICRINGQDNRNVFGPGASKLDLN
jgi:hypothetical protein